MTPSSHPPRLSVVTVLYGGLHTLQDTLPTWRDSFEALPLEIVVVDNSPDEVIKEFALDTLSGLSVRYLHNSSNVGFAAAANQGARIAVGESLLFLNADVFMTRQAAVSLLAHHRTPSGAVQLRTGPDVFAGVELSWYGFLNDRKSTSSAPCIGPSGGGGLLRRDLFHRFGGFDEAFFAWGEDAALALRLTGGGVLTTVLPIELDHVGGHSVQSLAGQRFKARLLARNRVWTFRMYLPRRRKLLAAPAFALALTMNGVLRKVQQHTIREYLLGIWEGLTSLPASVPIGSGRSDG